MAVISTKDNELEIVMLVTRYWPPEKRERLLREIAANQESKGRVLGIIKLDKG